MGTGPEIQQVDGGLTIIQGIKASGISCGLKKNKKDLAVIYSELPAVAAGVFTRNLVQAAPVKLCRERAGNLIRAIVVNSGNANACTGEIGLKHAYEMAELAGRELKVSPEQVLVCSTGVIGQQLPIEKIRAGISQAASALTGEPSGAYSAAEAILTTDTVIKQVAYRARLPRGVAHLAGIAKGSGMIAPNMATMLAFLVTDVRISRDLLQKLFSRAVDCSFNLVTVDGDTSTNDTALLLANGASGAEIKEGDGSCELFYQMLEQACRRLAYQIVADGEGATRVIALTITGAPEASAAGRLAKAVLNSSLVKTAFYGGDANWGRIMSALGNAGVDFDPAKVDIYLGPVQVAAAGGAVEFDEQVAQAVLQQTEVPVLVDLHAGKARVQAWGADLSPEYISINSSYRS